MAGLPGQPALKRYLAGGALLLIAVLLAAWWFQRAPTDLQAPVLDEPSQERTVARPARARPATPPPPEDPLDPEVLDDAAKGAYGIELRNRICALCRSGALEAPACSTCSEVAEGRVVIDLVGSDGRPLKMFDGMVSSDCKRRMAMSDGFLDLPVGKCTLWPVRFDGALAVQGTPVEIEVGENEEQYQLLEVPAEPHGGIGITVRQDEGAWLVEGLIAETAAIGSGLEPGMELLSIDGTELGEDLPVGEVIQLLVGPRGTEVEVTVSGPQGEQTLTLDRREITGQQIGLLGGQPG